VKDDCRNDPKSSRKILALIAREHTPEKMLALYTKYKANGLTRGEIIKQAAKPKLPKVPMAAEDIAAFCERLDVIGDADHTLEQKTAINLELVKLRSVAYQKMKLFKV